MQEISSLELQILKELEISLSHKITEQKKIVKEAKELGDLSENFEWSSAIADLKALEEQLSETVKSIKNSVVVTSKSNIIGLGSRLRVTYEGKESFLATFTSGNPSYDTVEKEGRVVTKDSVLGKIIYRRKAGKFRVTNHSGSLQNVEVEII